MGITLARLSALNEKDIKKNSSPINIKSIGAHSFKHWNWLSLYGLFSPYHSCLFQGYNIYQGGQPNPFKSALPIHKKYGNNIVFLSLNSSTIILVRARLCGTPFTAAFFSKEPIIEINIYNNRTLGIIVFILISLSITLLYSSRLIKIVLRYFNSITPITHTTELDTNLNKGIFLLSLPSFSRGSVIASVLYLKPTIFLYNLRVKIFIFSSFLIIFIILFMKNYPVIHIGLIYLFPMWRLRLFSGAMFNKISYTASFYLKSSGFSTPLYLFRGLRTIHLLIFSSLYGRHLIYRIIITIPFFYILFNMLY